LTKVKSIFPGISASASPVTSLITYMVAALVRLSCTTPLQLALLAWLLQINKKIAMAMKNKFHCNDLLFDIIILLKDRYAFLINKFQQSDLSVVKKIPHYVVKTHFTPAIAFDFRLFLIIILTKNQFSNSFIINPPRKTGGIIFSALFFVLLIVYPLKLTI
jgi:hypothetical protein